MRALCTPPFKGKSLWFTARFRCVLRIVRFPSFLLASCAQKELLSDLLIQSWLHILITTSGQQMLGRGTAVMGKRQTSLKTNIQEIILTENARSHIHFQKSNALPLEPVPQNHFGPTDASKGRCRHGDHDASLGEHEFHKTGYRSLVLWIGERQDKTKRRQDHLIRRGRSRQTKPI